ncbi:MAG: TolC family protein [Armatimonadota bacterium]
MQKIWWILIGLALLSASMVRAEETPAPLTEAAAVQLALQHNPMLRMAQAEVGMARARIGMARSEGALQISANGLATASDMRSVLASPVMPTAYLQSQDRSSADVNGMAMLPLITGGRIRQTVKAAVLTESASESQLAAARVVVAFEARSMLAELRQALAMVVVAQDTLAAQTKNAEVTQQLFAAGKVPKFDVLRAQAAQADAQQLLANAQADVVAARARLAQALGVPEDTLGMPVDEALVDAPAHPLETALATRPELRAAQQTIAAAEATVKARKASYSPQVYAVGMVDAFSPADMGKSSGYTVGVVAGVPLFDGGRRKAEVQEAEQVVAQTRASRDKVELQVRAEVATAQARVIATRQNIDTAAAQVAAATEAYTVAQARYNAGKSNIVELLDARQALTEAQQSQVAAQAQYRAALADLYRATGVDTLENPK